jgi:hypothetical protein
MRPGPNRPERSVPWSRIFLAAAVIGPPLWIGGVPPEVVPAFVLVVALACNRLCTRSSEPLRVPWVAVLGLFAIGVTLLQWLPLGARGVLAPGLHAEISTALARTDVNAWPGLSPTPGDTALEVARLVGMTALCIAAAQLSWRTTTAMVAVAGSLVALIGFAHELAGSELIYGTYRPKETVAHAASALLGSFVNPNHQSGLLLLGVFAAGGLAVDQRRLGHDARDPAKVDRHADRFLAAIASLTIQLPALLLSLSRGAIVALLLVGPFALWLAQRHRRPSTSRPSRRRRVSRLQWLVLAGMTVVLLVVAQHGAWRELATLADLFGPEAELYVKLRMVADSPAIIGLSPVLGVGPGAFVDLFPAVDSQPTHAVFTHMESGPMASILRWGPFAGGIVVIALGVWWVAAIKHGGRRREATARRIVLLGVLALGLQSLADFSLEFLGVGASAAALVGGLSPPRWLYWRARTARRIVLASSAAALVLAAVWLPSTWAHRERRNEAMMRGELEAGALLHVRPLDGRLHGLLARKAADLGAWEPALVRASVATRLRPGSIDAWLLRAAAQTQTGAHGDATASTRHALGLLRTRAGDDLVRWLLQWHPDPEDLVAIAPTDDLAWRRLAEGVIPISAHHADALAAARSVSHPDDAAPLRIRSQLALRGRNPALALHHARLLRELAPEELSSHLATVAALRAFSPPRHEDARDALERALEQEAIDAPRDRAVLHEELLRTLLALGDATSLQRAREVSDTLMRQPAERAHRRRWETLAKTLEEAEQRAQK